MLIDKFYQIIGVIVQAVLYMFDPYLMVWRHCNGFLLPQSYIVIIAGVIRKVTMYQSPVNI